MKRRRTDLRLPNPPHPATGQALAPWLAPSRANIHARPGSFGLIPDCGFAPGLPIHMPLEEPCLRLKNETETSRRLWERCGVVADKPYPSPTSITTRQWSLDPHSSTSFSARTLMLSWNPRDANT